MSCTARRSEVTHVVRTFAHEPVLVHELVELIASARPSVIVDCTIGGGGHAAALLEAIPGTRVVGLDRDPDAVEAARARLVPFGERAAVVHGRFSHVTELLVELSLVRVDAILVDLGVSSHQLDSVTRGFSFRADSALDMRMDATASRSALDVLAEVDVGELTRAIRDLGEERRAKRVARAIIEAAPTTTAELAAVVRRVVPKARDGLDPATRTFQALRMLVNDELGELDAWLAAVPELLEDGGVAVAISFHSLEDRAVKNAFRRAADPCTCPPRLPRCVCGKVATLEPLTSKPVRPSAEESARNRRARSARMRAVRRIARCR